MLEDQVDGEDVHVLENPTDPDSSSHRQISEIIIMWTVEFSMVRTTPSCNMSDLQTCL